MPKNSIESELEFKIVNINSCKTSTWLGGTTTELCIYPQISKYSDKNFLWRVSTATCEIDKSKFTILPNIKRELMILDGNVKLEHKDRYSKELTSYEKDSFYGDWETVSYGKCIDFNLMIAKDCMGKLDHFIVDKSNKIIIKDINKYKSTYFGIYIYKGDVEIFLDNKNIKIREKELLMIKLKNNIENKIFEFRTKNKVDIVSIEIRSVSSL